MSQPENPWSLDRGMNGVKFKLLIFYLVRLNGNKLILPFSNSFKKTHKPIEITSPRSGIKTTYPFTMRIIPRSIRSAVTECIVVFTEQQVVKHSMQILMGH